MVRCLLLLILAALPAGAQAVTREVTFPSDGLAIPGSLTLPAGTAPKAGWPVVVFVHGSGPNDRDESAGPNKPFQDIAEGLAARSVASLRYDKRTWLMAHGKAPVTPDTAKHITLAIEVVNDAVAALAFAAAQAGVDPKRVFLLGHSLGGSLGPRIAKERMAQATGSVRGLIELAAGALPVSVILPTQVAFQGALAGSPRAGQQLAILGTEGALNAALDLNADPAAVGATGLPNSYWREWNAVDTAAELAQLGLPALVMHGERDVQITYLDYVLLGRAAKTPGSKAVQIPGVGHLFLPSDGLSNGAEFRTMPSHVPALVADTIAAWLP